MMENHRKKTIRVIYTLLNSSKRIIIKLKIARTQISKETTNRSKRNRTYCNYRNRKNNTPKIYFGPNYISEGEINRTCTEDRRHHHSKKPTA